MPSYAEDDDSWKVIVVSTVCLSVSIIFVALRLYVRKVIIKELGTDDQVLCATLVNPFSQLATITELIPGRIHRSHCLDSIM
jgi:hypothetical protein